MSALGASRRLGADESASPASMGEGRKEGSVCSGCWEKVYIVSDEEEADVELDRGEKGDEPEGPARGREPEASG